MRVFWLEAQPWNYATSAAATIFACSEDLSAIVHFGGGEFLPVIDGGPIFVTEVFDGAFSGRADSARGEINLLAQFGDIDQWATYAWQGRPIQIYSADINTDRPSAPTFPTTRTKIFDGLTESYDPDEATLHLVMRPPEGKVASLTYAGTGGAAGSTSLKGVVKPFAAGAHTNRPAKLIDATKLLFQVHGYGAIAVLNFVRERGIKLDQPFTYHATAAALLAAVVPATQIHVCVAEGLFRLGFTPQGEITADFTGGLYNGVGANDLANVVLLLLKSTGWDMTKIDQPSIDALYAATIVPIQFYDDSGIDIVTALSSLLAPASAYWDVDELGIFYVGIFQVGTVADFSVGDEGQADFDMLEVDYLPTRAPFWKTRVGYAENPFTMTFADTEAAPSLFTWVAYANNITGTLGFTTGPNTGQTHIGIASNQPTETKGTDPAAYVWALIKGADGAAGPQGTTGSTGAAGAQGASLFTWIAYANNATGTAGFTTGAWTNQTYIGISNNQASSVEGADPAAYTWSLIQGSQGVPGTAGANGAPTFTWFAYANNATGTSGFTTGAWTNQTYLGIAANKTTDVESQLPADYSWSLIQGATGATGSQGGTGPQGLAGSQGPSGPQGATLYTWIAYANNATGTAGFTTGAWTNQTYIGISNNQASPTEGADPAAYTWSLIQGSQGVQGTQGPNGEPTYTWFAYANNATGTSGFTTGAWTNQTYLGLAANKTTPVEGTDPAAYSWSLIQGAQGAQGNTGLQGNAGPQGASLFTWIAYANNITGTSGFTIGNNTGQTHIGISNNQASATEGTDPAAYTWSLIQGTQGVQGTTGSTGATTYTWFAYANNATGTVGFTTGAWTNQTYLGLAANQATPTESQDPAAYTWSLIQGATGAQGGTGPQGLAGSQGATGPQGTTLYTWIAYANDINGASGFTTAANTGQTHIGIANNKTTPTESQNPAEYTWSLIRGTEGVAGTPGANGVTTYTWFAYANSANGVTDFTTGEAGERRYLGLSANQTSATESIDPVHYTWSLINLTVANQGRLDGMENGATAGADINVNVFDGGDPAGRIRLPRGEIRTRLGVSSGFTNQRNLSTRHYIQTGLTNFDIEDRAGLLLDGAAEWANNTLVRTPSGIASGIANQADWATYTGLSTGIVAGRVSRVNNNGRIGDPRMYNTQALVGPSNTTNLVPSYTINANNVTVNLPAHVRNIASPSGPVGISYGAGSFLIGFGAYWIAVIDDAELTGFAAPTINVTVNPNDLLVPFRYHVASGYAPSATGTGGSSGGGGGGGFAETCVSADAFVAVERYGVLVWIVAADVQAGDRVWTMLDANTAGWTDCTGNKVVIAPSVRLTLPDSRTIECSKSTPITQPDMTAVPAQDALGELVGYNHGERVVWARVALVEDIGPQRVAHLSCNDGTYLAGTIPGEGVFTHNSTIKP